MDKPSEEEMNLNREMKEKEEEVEAGRAIKKQKSSASVPQEEQSGEESDSDAEYEGGVERDLEITNCEEFESLEDNWQRDFDHCQKNEGHKDFIKVNDFRLHHIPKGWRRKEILRTIRLYTAFTVKVISRYTSKSRPNKFGIIGDLDYRGTKFVRAGSGRIDLFNTLWGPIHQTQNQPCPLVNCPFGKEPHEVSATFYVYTAAHVVYDDEEARHTEVQIVVDNVPADDPNAIIRCQGFGVMFLSEKDDACYFKCVTHELDKLHIIQNLSDGHIAEPADDEEEEDATKPLKPEESLTFIASFPHGTAKHITVGTYMVKSKIKDVKSFTLMDIYKMFGDCRYENLDGEAREAAKEKFGFTYHCLSERFSHCDRPVDVAKIIERVAGGPPREDNIPRVLQLSLYSKEFKDEYESCVLKLDADFLEKMYLNFAKDTLVNLLKDFSQTIPSIYYATATCPGSSGGPVFVFQPDSLSAGFQVMVAPHSRKSKTNPHLNVSGIGAMWDTEHTKFPVIMKDVFN